MVDHVVILAGGAGTRLWPASVQSHPKQFLDLGDGRSLLRMTAERALAVCPTGKIVVVTHRDHAELAAEHLSALPEARGRVAILPEPVGRNTAPAIAFAEAWLRACGGAEATAMVMPADHLIEPMDTFRRDVGTAAALARDGHLVTFGIVPDRPETGYGYIEAGEPVGDGRRVAAFKEKPDTATAQRFLEAGNFWWNSGMFLFRLDRFREECAGHAPEIHRLFSDLPAAPDSAPADGGPAQAASGPVIFAETDALRRLYAESPSISIDYAVMERCTRAAVVPAGFSWNDIGSWDEFARLARPAAEQGRVLAAGADPSRSFVLSDLPVALVGVDDLIVIVKNGSVLVCRRGESQSVKEIVEELRKEGRRDLL